MWPLPTARCPLPAARLPPLGMGLQCNTTPPSLVGSPRKLTMEVGRTSGGRRGGRRGGTCYKARQPKRMGQPRPKEAMIILPILGALRCPVHVEKLPRHFFESGCHLHQDLFDAPSSLSNSGLWQAHVAPQVRNPLGSKADKGPVLIVPRPTTYDSSPPSQAINHSNIQTIRCASDASDAADATADGERRNLLTVLVCADS